jgi:hypothetical protein
LTVGDSTALAAGDPVVLVGNPSGLAFTVHEGVVSYVGRDVLGVAYVQLNADVNPGNSGGPLLDVQGRVVGIVSIKILGADRIGLALPIEYARPAAGLAAPAPEAAARWKAIVDRVEEEDRREVEAYRRKFTTPAVAAAGVSGQRRIAAAVLQRWPGVPTSVPLVLEVREGERVLCSGAGTVVEWTRTEDQMRRALQDAPDVRRMQWALKRKVSSDLYVGTLEVDVSSCPADVPATAVLAIRGGEPLERPVRFPGAALAGAGEAGAARRQETEAADAEAEASWRAAFRKLHERIARLEEKRAALRTASGSGQATAELNAVEAKLAEARQALDDLERKASQAAVPREWRQ